MVRLLLELFFIPQCLNFLILKSAIDPYQFLISVQGISGEAQFIEIYLSNSALCVSVADRNEDTKFNMLFGVPLKA